MEIRTWISNPFCRPESDPLRADARPWQHRPGVQLIGATLAAVPLIALALWMYVVREETATLAMMLGGPLVGGGILIVWTLLIHRVVCGDRPAALGLRTDRWWLEVALGLAVAAVLFTLHMVLTPLLMRLFPPQPPPEEILDLLAGRWAVIVGCAALVAGAHLYQPPAIMLSIGVMSVLKGWYFLRTGRFWSLVVAHALYDSVQVAVALSAIRAVGL